MIQEKTQTQRRKSETAKIIPRGRIYITATFNNTLVTFTDPEGNVISWGSTGSVGFSGSKKSTPYAATMAISRVVNQAKTNGLRDVEVYIKGPGPGRDAALRVLRASGLKVSVLADVTPMPHNGSRPRKKKHNR